MLIIQDNLNCRLAFKEKAGGESQEHMCSTGSIAAETTIIPFLIIIIPSKRVIIAIINYLLKKPRYKKNGKKR